MDKFTFTFPCEKHYVSTARLTATSIAAIHGFDVEKIEDIRIAVGEACNNAVIHSCKTTPIELVIRLDQEVMEITIVDAGVGFDPENTHQQPSIKDYEGSGLGLFIIRALMDEVAIESKAKEGTSITMTKRM